MPDSQLIVPATYAELRRAVEVAMVHGQRAIERAKVGTYWETGRLIRTHLLANKERADYGARTVERLAEDVQIDVSVLQRCARFAERFPIVATWPQLTWAHFRVLIPVDDPKQRRALATEANRNQWSVLQLEQRIRSVVKPALVSSGPMASGGSNVPPRLLTPKRGTPGVCRVIAVGEARVVDLGFATYLDLPAGSRHGAGDFVRVTKDDVAVAKDATKADLFTYAAAVLKVVDGDTLWVNIYLRPDQWVKQKLRLRDLDCPEMDTPEGKAAKRFTEALVPAGTTVTICTTRPDKYDRYLADVFVGAKAGESVYLNNALLAAGHAVVKRAWEFSDWNDNDNR